MEAWKHLKLFFYPLRYGFEKKNFSCLGFAITEHNERECSCWKISTPRAPAETSELFLRARAQPREGKTSSEEATNLGHRSIN
jgi:hypothetical protein